MLTKVTGGLLALALLAPAGGMTQLVPPVDLNLQPGSKLWVEGTSTVQSFSCTAADVEAKVDASSASAPADVLAGAKAVRTVTISLPARGLDCKNGQMNGHMYKAIKADAAPVIRYQLTSYELVPGADGATVKLNGKLSLGGTEKTIAMDAKASAGPGGVLKITGSHPILMSEFGLKAPSLMFGTMKVGDRVTVRYDLALKP